MSVGLWVLVGLSAAGMLLALVAVIAVVVQALRLRKHVRELKDSPLTVTLLGLRIQANHLSHALQRARPLTQRAGAAVGVIQNAAQEAGLPQARAAMQQTGAELSTLADDLR